MDHSLTNMKIAILLLSACGFASAATGEVVWMGTVIGTSGSYSSNGNTISKVFDRDWTTYWDSPNASGDWAGLDAGAGNTVQMTRYRIAAKPSSSAGDFSAVLIGAKIQCDSNSAFTSAVTIDTIPSFPYVPNQQWTDSGPTEAAAGTGYRYCRVLASTQGSAPSGAVAELEFIVQASGVTGARPVEPAISPWGGIFPASVAKGVTIASATTSATIYYTLDGTTPTTSSTQYSGAFDIELRTTQFGITSSSCPDGKITLKAVAYDASLSTTTSDVSTATFNCGYVFDRQWTDDLGNIISAVDGSIYYESGWYYWTGRYFRNANLSGVNWSASPGVWVWKSQDLMNWIAVGEIVACPGTSQGCQGNALVKRSTDGMYVLWINDVDTASGNRILIYTSSSIASGWSLANTINVGGTTSYGHIFIDDDGSPYWYSGPAPYGGISIWPLTPDWTGLGTVLFNFSDGRDCPVLFKNSGTYYMLSASANDYLNDSTMDVRYRTATTLNGTWTTSMPLYSSTAQEGSPSFALKLANGKWMMLSSFYHRANHYTDSFYWIPLVPSGSSLTLGITDQTTSWNPKDFYTSQPPNTAAIGSVAIAGSAAIK